MSLFTRRSFLATAISTPLAVAITKTALAAETSPKFKLGLVSYMTSATWDLPTTLAVAKRVGLAALECRTTHKHGIEPSLSQHQRQEVKKQFADSDVTFWGSGTTCEFHSPDPKVVQKNIETCKKFVKLVSDLGGVGVKVRPNGVAKGATVDQACEQIGKALIECGNFAADAGLEICVEVHGSVTALPVNMKKIMDACGHKSVGVTWNSNDSDVVDGSIAENFELLAPHIKSCHLHDIKDAERGTYPYRDLFQRLKKMNYDRFTMIEASGSFNPKDGEAFLREYKSIWEELVTG